MSEAIGASYSAYIQAAGGMPQSGQTLRPGTDDRMVVIFTRRPVQNEAKSMEAGRPIFDAVDYVRIQHPGERDYVERPINASDPHRWPRQWQAYQQEQQQVPEGTPLDVLFPGEPQIGAMLKHFNVLTVEHLAGLEGNALSNIGSGANAWKLKAQKFMEAAQSAAPLHAAEKLIAEQAATIDKLQGQVDDMQAALSRVMAKMGDDDDAQPRRRRG